MAHQRNDSLDTVARAAFSYDFDCLSGEPNALAESLDGLTNNENKLSSFYMRALFWIFPSILSIGKKGEMIRRTKYELGAIASKMWADAKVAIADHSDDKSLMALMRMCSAHCKCPLRITLTGHLFNAVKADAAAGQQTLDEDQIVSQMRTILSAGYETVSAIVAVRFLRLISRYYFSLFRSLFSGFYMNFP